MCGRTGHFPFPHTRRREEEVRGNYAGSTASMAAASMAHGTWLSRA
jgi:hypothetical protein